MAGSGSDLPNFRRTQRPALGLLAGARHAEGSYPGYRHAARIDRLCAMKNRLLLAAAWSVVLVSSTPALAQLAPPNDIGVALGHIHVVVKDVEAQKQFWTTMLGGTIVTNGPLTLIQFPGI